MHLLVIEDDPRLVRLLRRLLEEDRHVVETATTGLDGLDIAEATTGIEVVILDIGLPDISGLEVARRIRATGSEVVDPDAHRARHRRRPGDRARRRRRRLPRQAVRLRGAGGPAAGARPARRAASAGPSRSSWSGPIVLDETSRRVTLDGKIDRPQPARVLAARVPAPPSRARRCRATSCSTRPGRSAWR